MAEAERRRLRPFPGVHLEFGHDSVVTTVSERIAVADTRSLGVGAPSVRSAGLGELRRILEAAGLRHADLSRQISEAESGLADVRRRLRLAQLFVARLVLAPTVPRLMAKGEALIDELARDRAERLASKVEVRFAVDAATTAAYAALTRAFEDLAENERIWEVAATTEEEPAWTPLTFSVGASDIVACPDEVLVASRVGGSVQFLPGFVLLRDGAEAIVLEHAEVELQVGPARFLVEDTDLPRDAKVVGQAVPPQSDQPKDKSPPTPRAVVEYGRMRVLAAVPAVGAQPSFVFSNYAKARVFAEAYQDYKDAFAAIVEPSDQPPAARPPPAALPEEPPLTFPPQRQLWLDWVAVAVMVFLLGLPFALYRPSPPAPPPRVAATHLAVTPKATPAIPPPAHPAAKLKHVRGKAPASRPDIDTRCGLMRQASGELKLVPCDNSGAAP